MESSIAQMMGESDSNHPIYLQHYLKSHPQTKKERDGIYICRTYLSFVVSIFQPNSDDDLVSSSSNQLMKPSLFFYKKKYLIIIHKRCLSPTHNLS